MPAFLLVMWILLAMAWPAAAHAQPSAANTADEAEAPEPASTASPTAAPKVAFTLDIVAPAGVKEHLQRHLELRHYLQLLDMDRTELDRLLEAAQANARELLATQGYFAPDIRIEARDTPDQAAPWAVTVTVAPGTPVRVSQVSLRFSGAIEDAAPAARATETQAERQLIHSSWGLQPGEVFTQAGWDSAKTEALRLLTASRYPRGRIQSSLADIDPDTHEARLSLELDSGPAFRFGTLEVQGTQHHHPELVRRLAQIIPGTPYTQAALLKAQQRVADSGYFDSVFMAIDTDDDPETATVRVQVREARLQKLVLGAGASTDSGARLSLEHTHRLLPGLGWRAVSKLALDRNTKTAGTEWTSQPDDDNWRWVTAAQLQRQTSGTAPVNSILLRAGRTQTEEQFDRSYYLQYDRAHTQSIPSETAASLSVNYAWTRRRFDNIPFPSRGDGLAVELGTGVTLGSQHEPFLRTRARWLHYQPLGERPDRSLASTSRLVWRTEAGAVVARDSAIVPATQRFLTGGDNTVRGYGYRQIGVLQPDGDITAGRYLVVGSLEWRRPLLRKGVPTEWEHTLFVDAGSVADHGQNLKAKVGVGTGVRWRSPVGPLQMDLAWGASTRKLRLHLSVGFTF